MRFKEFKVLLEAEKPAFVVGDSIAVGIKQASGAPGSAKGGESTAQVLARVKDLVQSEDVNGVIVILSSGASNSAPVAFKDGRKQSPKFGPIDDQLKVLKAAGARPVLVGVGSGKSQLFKGRYGEYQVDLTGVNDQLAEIAASNDVPFLGPLERFDNALSPAMGGDGIHPYNGYRELYRAGIRGESNTSKPSTQQKGQGGKPEAGAIPLTGIEPPHGDRGPEIADIQKVLKAEGYGELLGNFGDGGVDGILGKYTSSALRAFQKDNGIKTVTGTPDDATITKLNNIVSTKYKGKIAKSTDADVKSGQPGGSVSAQRAVKNRVDPAAIKSYLSSKGLDRNQVAGIMANIQHESGFDSGAIGDNGTSGGLVQHHNERFAGMVSAAGGDDKWQTNWKAQLDYALSEPAGRQYKGMKFSTPEEATKWWTINFEKPANMVAQANTRSMAARQYA